MRRRFDSSDRQQQRFRRVEAAASVGLSALMEKWVFLMLASKKYLKWREFTLTGHESKANRRHVALVSSVSVL